MSNFPRGSEWRKWDLHVHTPFSIVNHFERKSDEDVRESYIKDLENLPEDIKVIWINDYIFLDWYKKVLEYKSQWRLANIDLILPVIELRLARFWWNEKFKRINYHIIFSDELTADIIQAQFINQLSSKYTLSPEWLGKPWIQWWWIITKENLELLWKCIKESVPERERQKFWSDLIEGFNNLNIESTDIKKALEISKPFFEWKYITAIGKTEWDDFHWGDSSIAEKKNIINSADIIFTASESVDKYNASKDSLIEQWVKDTLLDCSDAHYNSWSTEKDRIWNCNTWIKADPTFEWLKQIVYEPKERIKIQEYRPWEKEKYQVIDKVKFIDDKFDPSEILLNENLNVIIWWKSTWKSILLKNIAKTIDSSEVQKRLAECNLDETHWNVDNFEVYRCDWQKNVLASWSDESKKKIIYIPQSYLNRLVDKTWETWGITEMIIKVLKKEENIKKTYEEFDSKNRKLSQDISKKIEDFFYSIEDWKKLNELIKEIWDKVWIEKEIQVLNGRIEALQKKAWMTEEELNQLKLALLEIDKLDKEISLRKENARKLTELQLFKYFNIDEDSKNIVDSLPEWLKVFLSKKLDEILEQSHKNWCVILKETITSITKENETKQKELEKKRLDIKPLLTKYEKSTELDIETKKLENEKKKLELILLNEKKLNELRTSTNELKEEILSLLFEYHKNLTDAKEEILKQWTFNWDNWLEFSIEIIFNKERFKSNYLWILNRSYRENNEFSRVDEPHSIWELNTYIKNLFTKIINGKQVLKNNFSIKDAIIKLNQSWFDFKYIIKYEWDNLDMMSPWKKSFVLLKLLIQLDNSKCPILLDQPEDDLDNRSIYNELASFIKEKKKERQIIIVTHNPNLVVWTDSECVIVANQQGVKTKNRTYNFEYLEWSLENTKLLDINCEYTLEKQGIQEHVCEILEWGKEAFEQRKNKYNFIK